MEIPNEVEPVLSQVDDTVDMKDFTDVAITAAGNTLISPRLPKLGYGGSKTPG